MSIEYIGIGELVKRLQHNYPDLSVSKVRFLEDEGLISPKRSASGYRKYAPADIERLEKILYLQKSYFYPLSIIKEELDKEESKDQVQQELQSRRYTDEARSPLPLGAEEKKHPIEHMPELIGVDIQFVRKLAEFNIITLEMSPKGRTLVDGHLLSLIKTCYELKRFGVEPRHLKSFLLSVQRESLVFETVLSSIVGKQKSEISPEDKQRFALVFNQLEDLTHEVRRSLLKQVLQSEFKNLDLKAL